MIPKNITRDSVLSAIKYIDENGIPKNRLSHTYNLRYNNRLYPPKYLISIANKIVNGTELTPFVFGGGVETNTFLQKLGFEITPYKSKDEHINVTAPDTINIVTVVIENHIGDHLDNDTRYSFMESIINVNKSADIILFPAGYFYFDKQHKEIETLCNQISLYLKNIAFQGTACFGIDCDDGKDQLAFAVNSECIQAIGRKFYPTDGENGYIREAKSYNETEMGYSRIFNIKGKSVFLAICYDTFGIRHCDLPDLGIDIVLVLAHQFWKRGEGPSGDVDFARKGFAGASQHWTCPVFGTAIFFCREIPANWPTGVLWTEKSQSVRYFKYDKNELTWDKKSEVLDKYEKAVCYKYNLQY